MAREHVTHKMTTQRRSLCGSGASGGHPIADVYLGVSTWEEVTCKRCLNAKARNEALIAKNAQPKIEKPEPTLEVAPLNPVQRDGMKEVRAFWGKEVSLRNANDEVVKVFAVTDNTVKNIIKYCDRQNLFPTNVRDGRIWV